MTLKPKTLAQAFWSFAAENDSAEAARACVALQSFAALMAASAEVRDFFNHPQISLAEKEQWMEVALKTLEAPAAVKPFLRLLIQKGLLKQLPVVAIFLQAIKNEALGIASVHVDSAEPLTSAERDQLKADLRSAWKAREVELEETVRPDLLGGAVFRIDGVVFNDSLKAKLSKVKQAIVL